jgi:uncharacterized protein
VILALGPFIVKRIVLLGEHDYVTWLAVDYTARCVAIAGFALGLRSGLIVRYAVKAGLVTSVLALSILVAAELVEQIAAYPVLRHYLRIMELSSIPVVPDAHLRLADLALGLLLVAVSEELVFRRFLFAIIERWSQNGIAVILISSAVFALIHLTSGIADTLNAFVHGVLLGGAFWKTRRVSVCIASHYLVDLWTFAH